MGQGGGGGQAREMEELRPSVCRPIYCPVCVCVCVCVSVCAHACVWVCLGALWGCWWLRLGVGAAQAPGQPLHSGGWEAWMMWALTGGSSAEELGL